MPTLEDSRKRRIQERRQRLKQERKGLQDTEERRRRLREERKRLEDRQTERQRLRDRMTPPGERRPPKK